MVNYTTTTLEKLCKKTKEEILSNLDKISDTKNEINGFIKEDWWN